MKFSYVRRGLFPLTAILCAFNAGLARAQNPTIVIDALTTRGLICSTAFGANHRFDGAARGTWDTTNQRLKPAFVDTFTTTGIGILRFPAGTAGNLYRWKRSIGPFASRTNNCYGKDTDWYSTEISYFGPDEFGQLLDRGATSGSIVVNFATGNAPEAAEWVEYMNAPVGTNPRGGTAWADTRAANGHPAPYGIKYWEVGNEYGYADQGYWLHPIESNPATLANLYVHGGSTNWTTDGVVMYADFSPAAMLGNGQSNQIKYARYPPVQPGEQLFVNGVLWLPTDLATTNGTAKAYQIDRTTGEIRFGNGTHGAKPGNGQEIRLTYTSGPHDGFVDFYREMKLADPAIEVYSSLRTDQFCQEMGAALNYDGLVRHYYPADVTRATRADAHNYWMVAPNYGVVQKIQDVRVSMAERAGAKAKNMKVIVTEFGRPGVTVTTPDPGEVIDGNTWSEALYYALTLQYYAEMGIPVGMKHMLTNPAANAEDILFPYGSGKYGLSATAHAFGQMNRLKETRFLANWTQNNPAGATSSQGTRQVLQVMASLDGADALRLLVTNVSLSNDVTATIRPLGYAYTGAAEIWQVNAPQVWSNNWSTHLNDVQTTYARAAVPLGAFDYRFPAHSITVIKLTKRRIADTRATLREYPFTEPSVTVPGWYPDNLQWYLTGKVEVTSQGLPDPQAGYALHLTGGDPNHGRATLTFPSTVTTGVLWISADVWAVDRKKSLIFTVTDDNRTASAGAGFSRERDGLLDIVKSDGAWNRLTLPYYEGAWMKLDLIVDIDHGMYDVWLDNYRIFMGEAYNRYITSLPIKKLNVETGTAADDTGDFYIDNVVVRQFTNNAPWFVAIPLTKPDATATLPYTASLAGEAFDPDAGDTLTYSIAGDPSWLTAGGNGVLSGTPPRGAVGLNTFTVRVTDSHGASDEATLTINVFSGPGLTVGGWTLY